MKKTEKTRTHFTFRLDKWTADGEILLSFVSVTQRLPGPLQLKMAEDVDIAT